MAPPHRVRGTGTVTEAAAPAPGGSSRSLSRTEPQLPLPPELCLSASGPVRHIPESLSWTIALIWDGNSFLPTVSKGRGASGTSPGPWNHGEPRSGPTLTQAGSSLIPDAPVPLSGTCDHGMRGLEPLRAAQGHWFLPAIIHLVWFEPQS